MCLRRAAAALLVVLLAIASSPASAEVTDKVVPLPYVWREAAVASLIVLIACRAHPLVGAVVLFFGAGAVMNDAIEFGDAILAEGGGAYLSQVHSAGAAVVASYAAGSAWWYLARRRRRARRATR